jgi:vacuolar-type H+-ATPase subunit F/Vma7
MQNHHDEEMEGMREREEDDYNTILITHHVIETLQDKLRVCF